MSYLWKTQVTWGVGAPTPADGSIIESQLATLITQNKTDGLKTTTWDSNGRLIVTRNWDSDASAQDWVSNVVGPFNPVSAVVIAPT